MPEITSNPEQLNLESVNTFGAPSDLKITDMRFVDVIGAPMHCTLLRLSTNQGIFGYGEVRDLGTRTYALMLKDRILGENPCNVDKIFRRIKQFGNHARQGGGVCGVEVALWDLAGKAFGVPVYQMLGGKFRDVVRMYCDTDVHGKHNGTDMGRALRERMEMGYTFLKMDLGIRYLTDKPGALNAPVGLLDVMRSRGRRTDNPADSSDDMLERKLRRNRFYDINNIAHPFSDIHITEHGLDLLEEYVHQVREEIGYEVPLAIDHFGHIPLSDCIRLARRLEKFNLAWLEDMIPWQLTDQYRRLSESTTAPICTGEDIYLKENFKPLLEHGGLSMVHPDVLSCGGILELKKIGDVALEYGVAMSVHMAESPVACLAAVHACAASENFTALEFHSVESEWWSSMVTGLPNPLVQDGFIRVPDGPGLGFETLDDDVLGSHLHPDFPELWASTESWNNEYPHDRTWS
ncbi:MAG: mandelate racemase/muconate lactonizing enzyme family protein [Spirochaetales bacterium]